MNAARRAVRKRPEKSVFTIVFSSRRRSGDLGTGLGDRTSLLSEGAETGELRDDVAPDELASYCLHALAAASSLPSKAAVRRLVTVTLTGLRPLR